MKLFLPIVFLTLFLSGCLVPERFNAEIDIKPDASYSFKYQGITLHALALAQINKGQPLSDKENARFAAEVVKLNKRSEFTEVYYQGDGRYKLAIDMNKKTGEELKIFDVFTVSQDQEGIMTISTVKLKKKDRQLLADSGIKIDGELSVRLPNNAEVLEHNATSTPYFFGLLGSYQWKIDSFDRQPLLRVRFKSE